MGKIVKQLEIVGNKGSRKLEVLFDSGAGSSVIRSDVVEQIATIFRLRIPKEFGLAEEGATMEAKFFTALEIIIDGTGIDGSFYCAEKLRRDVIIGVDIMQKWEITLEFNKRSEDRVIIGVDPKNIELV